MESLADSKAAIRKKKDASYGDPQISLGRIGCAWGAYLGVDPICASKVAGMMAIMKMFRSANPSCDLADLADSYVDAGVYIDIAREADDRLRRDENSAP